MFFYKQKTAYEMRISDWSSDVCSSDLPLHEREDWNREGRLQWAALFLSAPPRIGWFRLHRSCGVGPERCRRAYEISGYSVRAAEIGRASCWARVCHYVSISVVAVSLKKNQVKQHHIVQLLIGILIFLYVNTLYI